MRRDTIYATATGRGPAGIAIIRISGADAGQALASLTAAGPLPARRATRVHVRNDRGETLDEGLAIWFPAPWSFTGEDVAELHVHGSRAVETAVLEALAAMPGLRLAEAGEFARRAFDYGKMDLTAVEGLADLIYAETAAQRRQALRQVQGELAALYERWRRDLLNMLGRLEAGIDFADEDLPPGLEEDVLLAIDDLSRDMRAHLSDDRRGERLREGIRVAIVGPPNAGKSSLLNVLARRDAAIVSHVPGTTRDVVEVHLDIGGYPVVVSDTAGLREVIDEVEREGVRRSRVAAAAADLKVAVFDGDVWPETDSHTAGLVDGATLVVVSKRDRRSMDVEAGVKEWTPHAISNVTGEGIQELVTALQREVEARWAAMESPVVTRARHRQALTEAEASLRRAATAGASELVAEDLRMAARAIGRVTGRVDVEEVLDVIFAEFCIGK